MIAVSGIGALTPLGDTPDAIFAAALEGRSGATAIPDFDATKYAKVRGMRMYNRTTQLAICAAKLALADAKVEDTSIAGEDLGLFMASTYGHLDVLIDYDRSLVTNGLLRTNGALMPLAIPSAPGAMVALALGAKAFSMTFCDNAASFLDAMAFAARWIEDGRARACVVVGAFSASAGISLAATRAGILAPVEGQRIFDRKSAGTAIGEGSVAFVLERSEDAVKRGAHIHGHISGFGSTFAGKPELIQSALHRAAAGAMRSANVTADQLALVSSGASGLLAFDRAEAQALSTLLGERAAHTPLTAVKGNLGETLDAAGGFQSLIALYSIKQRKAPPIARFVDAEVPGLKYLTKEEPVNGRYALITSVSWGGACSALVLSGGDHDRS